ncbi:MAG: purine-cytosine permease family protein [Thermoplasmata archaeon]
MTIEQIGIERVDINSRRGSPRSLFTLWFAANLTIADFALGFIPIAIGLSFESAFISILIGNILGSIIVALSATMGPKTGYPQMMGTTNSMGRRVMKFFGVLNLSNTLGWFIINNILSVIALYLIIRVSYVFLLLLFVLVVYIIALVGHDFIHKIERILSYVLGILFLLIFIRTVLDGDMKYVNSGHISMGISFFGMIAFSYSYLMSWGPYASDYSRYLPESVSVKNVFLNVFLGSVISTTFVELVALIISYATQNSSPLSSLALISGKFYILSLMAIVLGGISANVLNLYSSTLSGLVGGIRIKRTKFVGIIAIVGLILSILFYSGFYQFFESFLFILDYWISPWVAILIIDFLIFREFKLNFKNEINLEGLFSYLGGLFVSIPFMNISIGSFSYTFPVSRYLGGIDISYFISFIVAGILYYNVKKRRLNKHYV